MFLAVACHKGPPEYDEPPDAQLGPHFVLVEPYYVPLHGAKVTATYSETLREDEYYGVDVYSGTVTTSVVATRIDDTHLTFDMPPAIDAPAPIDLALRRNFNAPDSRTHDAAKYIETPADPHLAPVMFSSTLWFPVHPELDRACARSGNFQFRNDGDAPITITSASAPSGFSIDTTMCPSRILYGQCVVRACFSSTTPGTASGMLTLETTAGNVSLPISATVLAPSMGLDPSFHGTGAVLLDHLPSYGYDVTAVAGGLLLWGPPFGLERLDSDGVLYSVPVPLTVNGFQANRVFGVAPAPDGTYVMVGDQSGGSYSALVRFDSAWNRDDTFGQVDLPITSYYTALARQSSGRLLAMSRTTVVAYKSGGAPDPSYGNAGRREIGDGFKGAFAVDTQDRLYLVLDGASIIRLTAAGNLDGTFAYSGTIGAIAVDAADRLYITTPTGIVLLDETGAATTVIANVDARDLAITDKLYVVTSSQGTRRYTLDGTLEQAVGFSSASHARCGSGACWIYGVQTGSYMQSFANEQYVVKLAP
jgi:hypothetical protein